MTGKIFINYRRGDSIATAGRLHDRLAQVFGRDSLFMDVDHIPPGVDFVEHLNAQVAACDVFLAVIGPNWLNAKDPDGRRRLDNPEDFVGVEIAVALAEDIRVIPVLIDGALMPTAEELPDPLKALARRNAVEVRNTQFGRDADALVEKLRGALRPERARPSLRILTAAVVALLLAGWIGLYEIGLPVWPWAPAATVPNGTGADKINADAAATTSRAGGDAEQQLATRKAEEARKKAEADLPPDPALGVTPGSGQSFRDVLANGMPCPICPDMVVVPSGSFTMGAPAGELGRRDNEGPSRQVSIPRPFAIGKFSVTRGEFAAFVNDSGYKLEGGCDTLSGLDWKLEPERSWRSPGFAQDDRHPVVCLSWNDAKIFAAMLAEKTGRSYRLLSEAEWEFAARAGTSTRYFFGDDDKEFCRYGNGADLELKKNNPAYGPVLSCSDGYPFTAPVGSFLANAFGLYDMHGNAWQWVEDCYHDSYAGAPSDGSVWKAGGCARRPIRGGSWASFPRTLRAASRFGNAVDQRRDQWGFRVGRSLTP